MFTPDQITAIIGLLMAFHCDPTAVANVQAILNGQTTITSATTTTQIMAPATPPAAPPPNLGGAQPSPAPASQARIEIISPLGGKGIRGGLSIWGNFDEMGNPTNQIDIGAVVYAANGSPVDNATVQVAVTLPDGAVVSATYGGTGNVRKGVPYYPFHYQFPFAGTYTIAFTSQGIPSASVQAQVSE